MKKIRYDSRCFILVRICFTLIFRGFIVVFYISDIRSSHRRYPFKKAVLKNFAIFVGKHLYWSLFLIKLQSPTQPFSCEYCEIFKTNFFEEHLQTAASVASQIERGGRQFITIAMVNLALVKTSNY